jgi:hypothetical protein
VPRIDRERTIIDGDRLAMAAEFLQHDAQIAQRIHRFRIDRDRRHDQRARLLMAALLMAQHAQQMQGVEMVGGVGEDFRVDRLGLFEVARLMGIDRLGEQRRKVDGMPDQAHCGMIVEPVADSTAATSPTGRARFPRDMRFPAEAGRFRLGR